MMILGFIFTYFFLFYLFLCRLAYRHGAGLYVHQVMKDLYQEPPFIFLLGAFWPVFLIVHLCTLVYHNTNVHPLFKGYGVNSFYRKGKRANDIDLQAEKHLLTEKKPWYKLGR